MKIKIFHWNCDFDDVEKELKKRGHEIVEEWQDADVVCLWNEIKHSGWLDIVQGAQKMGKKVILYQQGIWGIDRVQPPFNEKLHSDAICVWGEGDKERLSSYGVDPNKIFVTGTPITKHLINKIPHNGKNVVFALEHWDTEEIPENLIVASELRKLKGVNVITKALKREHDITLYDNVVATHRFDPDHLEIVADLLAKTDLVVAISESTFALLAECMDIPVIIADMWIPKERGGEKTYMDYRHPFSDAITKVQLEDLNKEIYHQLKHPEIKMDERKKQSIRNGGTNIVDPVNEIIKVIESYDNTHTAI